MNSFVPSSVPTWVDWCALPQRISGLTNTATMRRKSASTREPMAPPRHSRYRNLNVENMSLFFFVVCCWGFIFLGVFFNLNKWDFCLNSKFYRLTAFSAHAAQPVAVQLPFSHCPVDLGSSYIITRWRAWQPGAAVCMWVKPLNLEVVCTSEKGSGGLAAVSSSQGCSSSSWSLIFVSSLFLDLRCCI